MSPPSFHVWTTLQNNNASSFVTTRSLFIFRIRSLHAGSLSPPMSPPDAHTYPQIWSFAETDFKRAVPQQCQQVHASQGTAFRGALGLASSQFLQRIPTSRCRKTRATPGNRSSFRLPTFHSSTTSAFAACRMSAQLVQERLVNTPRTRAHHSTQGCECTVAGRGRLMGQFRGQTL